MDHGLGWYSCASARNPNISLSQKEMTNIFSGKYQPKKTATKKVIFVCLSVFTTTMINNIQMVMIVHRQLL
jgi:hypothetical protein